MNSIPVRLLAEDRLTHLALAADLPSALRLRQTCSGLRGKLGFTASDEEIAALVVYLDKDGEVLRRLSLSLQHPLGLIQRVQKKLNLMSILTLRGNRR